MRPYNGHSILLNNANICFFHARRVSFQVLAIGLLMKCYTKSVYDASLRIILKPFIFHFYVLFFIILSNIKFKWVWHYDLQKSLWASIHFSDHLLTLPLHSERWALLLNCSTKGGVVFIDCVM